MSDSQKEQIKTKLGQAIGLLGKTENFLMVGFDDEYDLYMGGEKLDKAAFVSVKVYGKLQSGACDTMTAKICDILQEELGIPGSAVYVTYQGIDDWGWTQFLSMFYRRNHLQSQNACGMLIYSFEFHSEKD